MPVVFTTPKHGEYIASHCYTIHSMEATAPSNSSIVCKSPQAKGSLLCSIPCFCFKGNGFIVFQIPPCKSLVSKMREKIILLLTYLLTYYKMIFSPGCKSTLWCKTETYTAAKTELARILGVSYFCRSQLNEFQIPISHHMLKEPELIPMHVSCNVWWSSGWAQTKKSIKTGRHLSCTFCFYVSFLFVRLFGTNVNNIPVIPNIWKFHLGHVLAVNLNVLCLMQHPYWKETVGNLGFKDNLLDAGKLRTQIRNISCSMECFKCL